MSLSIYQLFLFACIIISYRLEDTIISMDTPEPEPKRFQRGPCIVKFEGLYAMLKSKKHPSSTKRGMLVSHDFVDLYNAITIDH